MTAPTNPTTTTKAPNPAWVATKQIFIAIGLIATFYFGATIMTIATDSLLYGSMLTTAITALIVAWWRWSRPLPGSELVDDPTRPGHEIPLRHARIRTLGLNQVLVGFGTIACAWFASTLVLINVRDSIDSPGFERTSETLASAPVLVLLTFVIFIAPVGEEALMRGVIYPVLRQGMSIAIAALLSAVAFGLVHGNVVQLITTIPLGIIAALVYEATGYLRAAIGVHMTYNLLGLFAVGGPMVKFAGGNLGLVAAALSGTIAVLGIIHIYTATTQFAAEQSAQMIKLGSEDHEGDAKA